jgi:hypothetical protein
MIWISAGIDCGCDLAAQAGHGLAVAAVQGLGPAPRFLPDGRWAVRPAVARPTRQGYHTGW